MLVALISLYIDNWPCFIIEEPEAHIFPDSQKALVELFASMQDKASFLLSTHSPYILTSLNNLIMAKDVEMKLKGDEAKLAALEKIVPSRARIAYEDVAVYHLDNGNATSMMNKDNRLIEADKLDSVSESLGADFDKLLDMKYE